MPSNTEDFVPAVCAYHRAMATNDKQGALAHAYKAEASAPCDSEAAVWHQHVERLEYALSNPLQKVAWAVFGVKPHKRAWRADA